MVSYSQGLWWTVWLSAYIFAVQVGIKLLRRNYATFLLSFYSSRGTVGWLNVELQGEWDSLQPLRTISWLRTKTLQDLGHGPVGETLLLLGTSTQKHTPSLWWQGWQKRIGGRYLRRWRRGTVAEDLKIVAVELESVGGIGLFPLCPLIKTLAMDHSDL